MKAKNQATYTKEKHKHMKKTTFYPGTYHTLQKTQVPLFLSDRKLQTVVMTKPMEWKKEVAEMEMLRRMNRLTRKEWVKGVDERKEVQVDELSEKLRDERLHWYRHGKKWDKN